VKSSYGVGPYYDMAVSPGCANRDMIPTGMLRSVNKTTHMLLTHSNLVWVLVFVFTATEISEIDDKNYPYENI